MLYKEVHYCVVLQNIAVEVTYHNGTVYTTTLHFLTCLLYFRPNAHQNAADTAIYADSRGLGTYLNRRFTIAFFPKRSVT